MYFDGITTLENLKKKYRELAMKHHPDAGGDEETMKKINREYTEVFERIKGNASEAACDFVEIISEILKCRGLTVELCGQWLWIGGNTAEHKDALKAAGCHWSSTKKLWYWHSGTIKKRKSKMTMDEIRAKYGSRVYGANLIGETA